MSTNTPTPEETARKQADAAAEKSRKEAEAAAKKQQKDDAAPEQFPGQTHRF